MNQYNKPRKSLHSSAWAFWRRSPHHD